jgi:hypothetical protein
VMMGAAEEDAEQHQRRQRADTELHQVACAGE